MSNNDVKIKYDNTELNRIMRMLKEEYTLRVGIMGSKAQAQNHKKSDVTNAELGTFHEFGTSKMPERSFLFRPLEQEMQFTNPEMKELKSAVFKQFFVKNTPKQFFMDLGTKAMAVIEAAFNTNGFGEWKPLAASTEGQFSKARKRNNKKNGYQILTDTGKLRRSISMKILKRGS